MGCGAGGLLAAQCAPFVIGADGSLISLPHKCGICMSNSGTRPDRQLSATRARLLLGQRFGGWRGRGHDLVSARLKAAGDVRLDGEQRRNRRLARTFQAVSGRLALRPRHEEAQEPSWGATQAAFCDHAGPLRSTRARLRRMRRGRRQQAGPRPPPGRRATCTCASSPCAFGARALGALGSGTRSGSKFFARGG